MLHLYNTQSQKKERFTPLQTDRVTLYSCGPTVYDFAHIGNFRSFLTSDLLVRVLQFSGFTPYKVQNITDVGHLTNDHNVDSSGEDKISKQARLKQIDPYEIAQFYETSFIEDEAKLSILPPQQRPKATDYIKEQLAFIKNLMTQNFAYAINGSVYFRTKKFKEYGKLSHNNLDDLIAGARVEINSEKEDPLDFALWKKAAENHLMQWDFNTGEKIDITQISTNKDNNFGFPGWHIECSAMSLALLGENFDMHTGGEDNIFPHHECEMAQNECAHGGKINYWIHTKHLLVEGQKMSKSKQNFYTIKDLLDKGYEGKVIRYALLNCHYRTALNFSLQALDEAKTTIQRLEKSLQSFKEVLHNLSTPVENSEENVMQITKFKDKYKKSIQDDLNVAPALAAVFSAVKWGSQQIAKDNLSAELLTELIDFIEQDFNNIFAVIDTNLKTEDTSLEISAEFQVEIEALISKRNQARSDKNWSRADAIRDELLLKGIEIIDAKGITTWKMK